MPGVRFARRRPYDRLGRVRAGAGSGAPIGAGTAALGPPEHAAGSRRAPSRWSVPALQAGLGNVRGLALDGLGGTYVTSEELGLVFRVEPAGALTIVAGRVRRPHERGWDDGTVPTDAGRAAVLAFLKAPAGLAFDRQHRLLVADRLTRRIRRIDLASGLIETVAGGDGDGPDGDGGPAREARFVQPTASPIVEPATSTSPTLETIGSGASTRRPGATRRSRGTASLAPSATGAGLGALDSPRPRASLSPAGRP